ncbi:MAG: signal peptidase II [Patescibacteria group bacterium]
MIRHPLQRFSAAVLVVIGIDQLTKTWIESRSVLIQLNEGVSFGMLQQYSAAMVILLTIIVLLGCSYWVFAHHKRDYLLLGMFVGGGMSNLLDRVLVGGVRDWLPLPILGVRNNIADWAISLSVAVLLLLEVYRWYQARDRKAES